jgi:hypothetical protein
MLEKRLPVEIRAIILVRPGITLINEVPARIFPLGCLFLTVIFRGTLGNHVSSHV